MLNVTYRVDEKKVVTQLFAFSDRMIEHLKVELLGVAEGIETEIRASWSGHRKTGDMERSLRKRVKVYGGKGGKASSVWAYVLAGGTRKAAHAHLFERGFDGTEAVDAHERAAPEGVGVDNAARRAGVRVSVQAYQRAVSYPAREYMRKALESHDSATVAAVRRAVGGAVSESGLG